MNTTIFKVQVTTTSILFDQEVKVIATTLDLMSARDILKDSIVSEVMNDFRQTIYPEKEHISIHIAPYSDIDFAINTVKRHSHRRNDYKDQIFKQTSFDHLKILESLKNKRLPMTINETEDELPPTYRYRITNNQKYISFEIIEEQNEALFKPIEDIDIAIQQQKALEREYGFTYIGELLQLTDYELENTPRFGRISYHQILDVMRDNGLKIKPDYSALAHIDPEYPMNLYYALMKEEELKPFEKEIKHEFTSGKYDERFYQRLGLVDYSITIDHFKYARPYTDIFKQFTATPYIPSQLPAHIYRIKQAIVDDLLKAHDPDYGDLYQLNINQRVIINLNEFGIFTIEELAKIPYDQLLEIPKIGELSAKTIVDQLQLYKAEKI